MKFITVMLLVLMSGLSILYSWYEYKKHPMIRENVMVISMVLIAVMSGLCAGANLFYL